MRSGKSVLAGLGLVVLTTLSPAPARAQGIAVGPRFSFVRGDIATETPSSHLFGGSVRMRASAWTTLELSMDYRVTRSEDRTLRTRETPIQASLLVMPFRSAFTPYALAGVGIYSQKTDVLDPAGALTDSALTRRVGWHAGFGGELRLGGHAAVYADYRYQFVTFDRGAGTRVPFSHQGSMWASGVAFYF